MIGPELILREPDPTPAPPAKKRLVVRVNGEMKHPSASPRRAPMTFDEAAAALGLDKVSAAPRRMVDSLCRRGRLRSIKIGRFVFVDAESVDALLDAR